MPHRNKPLPTRIFLGITDHFPARRSEWVLAFVMMVWGYILLRPEPTFTNSVAWSQMTAIWSEQVWGWLAVSIGGFRVAALVINGTFSNSWYGRWSPHVRAVASFLSCFLWFQIVFGLIGSGAVTTGLAVYPGLFILDAMNIVAASKDAAGMDRAVSDGGL